MKKIEAIVRTEKLLNLKLKLRDIGVGGMTISNVSGWSKERELHLQYHGIPVAYDLLPRAKFEIVVPDEKVDGVISTILDSARSGEKGDGVIFITTIEQAINISSLEKGDKAITQPDSRASQPATNKKK